MIDTDHNQNSGDTAETSAQALQRWMRESANNPDTQEMPRYQSYKKVHALKIASITPDSELAAVEHRETDGSAIIVPDEVGFGPIRVDHAFVTKHKPEAGGYYVVYADGYKSFSPAKAFEDGYARIYHE